MEIKVNCMGCFDSGAKVKEVAFVHGSCPLFSKGKFRQAMGGRADDLHEIFSFPC